jgi:hypothetical protein
MIQGLAPMVVYLMVCLDDRRRENRERAIVFSPSTKMEIKSYFTKKPSGLFFGKKPTSLSERVSRMSVGKAMGRAFKQSMNMVNPSSHVKEYIKKHS